MTVDGVNSKVHNTAYNACTHSYARTHAINAGPGQLGTVQQATYAHTTHTHAPISTHAPSNAGLGWLGALPFGA
jgi:hypothetical protein